VDDIPTAELKSLERELYAFMEQRYPEVCREISEKKELGSDLEDEIRKALHEFKEKRRGEAESSVTSGK